MKYLVLLLLVSIARADSISGGQIFMSETPSFFGVDTVLNASFQAPGYSFTNVVGADFFTITPHLPYFCGWQNGGCTTEQIASTGPLAQFSSDLSQNGIADINGWIQFSATSFVGSFTSDGFTITGLASAEGNIVPCTPAGVNCGAESSGPAFFFNSHQRWTYNAHFGHFYDNPDLYALNDMTITSVPELDTIVLTLAGMGFTGILKAWRRKWFPRYS